MAKADYTGFKENNLDLADKYVSIDDADLVVNYLTQEGQDLYFAGEIYGTGVNTDGQIGDGSGFNVSTFVLVGSFVDWRLVHAGGNNTSFAIKTDGSLWSWGNDLNGGLGQGTVNIDLSTPVQVGTGIDWKVVSASSATQAIKKNGTLWSCGANTSGQTGLGGGGNFSSFQQIGSDADWGDVRNGLNHAVVLKENGEIWTFGNNAFGQLGNGSTTNVSTPIKVGTDTDWVAVGGSINSSFAKKGDGSIWAWGTNSNGILAQGVDPTTLTAVSTPVQIGSDTDWNKLVKASRNSMGAIKNDGTLWVWGQGSLGQLGTSTLTDYSTPVQVGSLTDWYDVNINEAFHAIKTDGTLWICGTSARGIKGNGDVSATSSPVQFGAVDTWTHVSGHYQHTFVIKK